MLLFIFSLVTVVATWILLVIGGIVNPMGASLACPDWYFVPTCNGEFFPEMIGGVLYEHGHRLWASAVGFLTLMLAVLVTMAKPKIRGLVKLTWIATFLVALQGTLGGVTVLLGLSSTISTLHLMIAMGFFCLLIAIAYLLNPRSPSSPSDYNRHQLHIALGLTFLQIALGGLIRHVGAGLACGDDWISCGPSLWPSWGLGQLHMVHRFVGYFLAAVVTVSCVGVYMQAKDKSDSLVSRMAMVPVILIFIQIILGLATVATVRSVSLVVMHTGVGALLLASLFWLFLLCGALQRLEQPAPAKGVY